MAHEVGETILKQLGGIGRLAMMTGAHGFVASKDMAGFILGAGAKSPQGATLKIVRVCLTPSDTYRVEFWAPGAKRCVTVVEDVYADMLVETFERETGFYLTFRRQGAGR